MNDTDIQANIRAYMKERAPERRYTSFDYCFNYFQSYREREEIEQISAAENIQLSSLQLGSYLASWGMFRGSSPLLTRSSKQFEPVVRLIAQTPSEMWEVDAHCYSREACKNLVSLASEIKASLHFPDGEWPTETLATKIMLGVFGNVPAFDTFVVSGLRSQGLVGRFGVGALDAIGGFYSQHTDVIELNREYTLDFETGTPTERRYTQAKVIDQIFVIEGGG